ncbi:DNase I-like protein [Calocera cornea HHB12733]|uniref:DNase I-like protein n=1 Tax=Calocera cornea HHB12733 TaxID=1353952 RepID=A0A165K420_9BASI|nr:DNase I-like protein [Calocera cornea HHB12733]
MAPTELKVLTLNCWGLKWLSADLEPRIHGIAESLAGSQYDVVAFQELWMHAHYEHFRTRLAKVLPYGKLFYGGALGAGLAIFSRYPIVETHTQSYPLNGSPLAVAAGDWFVGKAVGSVVLSHPALGEVEVFTTHMYASGGEDGPEEKRAHRLVQSWVLANLIRASAARGRHVVLTGDLNSIPTALSITLLASHAGLTDAFAQTHPSAAAFNLHQTPYSLQSAELAIRDLGITADSPLNTFSAGKKLDASARRWQGKRLDYVYYRSDSLRCTASGVVFTGKVPGSDFSFSDHFGLEATLTITPPGPTEDPPQPPKPAPPPPALTARTLSQTLQALSTFYRQSRATAHTYMLGFSGCVLALLALIIGSGFQPNRKVNPLLVILAAAATWGGTTLLYVGFVYGKWEQRALMTTIEEMEMEMRRVEGGGRGSIVSGSETASGDSREGLMRNGSSVAV